MARFLAQKYGHAWACESRVVEVCRKEELIPSVELIGAIMASKLEAIDSESLRQIEGMGIQQPTVENGIIVHTTGTKRLSWWVYENGEVEIRVSRPDIDPIIWVRVHPSGSVMVRYLEANVIFDRHVQAAKDAALCVADAADVEKAFEELTAFAQPDPESEPEMVQPPQERSGAFFLPPLMPPTRLAEQ